MFEYRVDSSENTYSGFAP